MPIPFKFDLPALRRLLTVLLKPGLVGGARGQHWNLPGVLLANLREPNWRNH